MTTNQGKAIDVAFDSRITVTIPYEKLENLGLVRVFEVLDENARRSGQVISMWGVRSEMERFLTHGDHKWLNGRSLRSLVSSAITLAISERKNERGQNEDSDSDIEDDEREVEVEWRHFQVFIDQADTNERYMEKLMMGKDEALKAALTPKPIKLDEY
jgi:hypothetical protein